MRNEKQDRPRGQQDIRTFRDQFSDYSTDRHRSPQDTYSPYTDEDYGSNVKMNGTESYSFDQSLDGSVGGSITFGRRTGPYKGVGPKGYVRSDERIHEEVCEMLTHHSAIDASEILCSVKDAEVTLSGLVPEASMKNMAEEVVGRCNGIKEIHNKLEVEESLNSENAGSKE